jgi:hypothetical protein
MRINQSPSQDNILHSQQYKRVQQFNPSHADIQNQHNLHQGHTCSCINYEEECPENCDEASYSHMIPAPNIYELLERCQHMLVEIKQTLLMQARPNNHTFYSRNNRSKRHHRRRFNNNTSEYSLDNNTLIQNIDNRSQIYNNRAHQYSVNLHSHPATTPSLSQTSNTYSQHSEEAKSPRNSSNISYHERVTQYSENISKNMDEIQCYRCKANGHYAVQCPTRRQSTQKYDVNHSQVQPRLPIRVNQSNQSTKYRTRIFTKSASMFTNYSQLRLPSESPEYNNYTADTTELHNYPAY